MKYKIKDKLTPKPYPENKPEDACKVLVYTNLWGEFICFYSEDEDCFSNEDGEKISDVTHYFEIPEVER